MPDNMQYHLKYWHTSIPLRAQRNELQNLEMSDKKIHGTIPPVYDNIRCLSKPRQPHIWQHTIPYMTTYNIPYMTTYYTIYDNILYHIWQHTTFHFYKSFTSQHTTYIYDNIQHTYMTTYNIPYMTTYNIRIWQHTTYVYDNIHTYMTTYNIQHTVYDNIRGWLWVLRHRIWQHTTFHFYKSFTLQHTGKPRQPIWQHTRLTWCAKAPYITTMTFFI